MNLRILRVHLASAASISFVVGGGLLISKMSFNELSLMFSP